MRAPRGIGALAFIRRRKPALAEPGQPRIDDAEVARRRPMHRQFGLQCNRDRAAQAIEGQALHQRFRRIALAIDQHIRLVGPDQEIEQRLALRGEQRRPHRQIARRIVGDEPLQETADVLPRQTDEGAVVKGCVSHARTIGSAGANLKPLPFRGGVGVGSIGLAPCFETPPASESRASERPLPRRGERRR